MLTWDCRLCHTWELWSPWPVLAPRWTCRAPSFVSIIIVWGMLEKSVVPMDEGMPKEASDCQLMVSPQGKTSLGGDHSRTSPSATVQPGAAGIPSSQGSLRGGDQTVITVSDRSP